MTLDELIQELQDLKKSGIDVGTLPIMVVTRKKNKFINDVQIHFSRTMELSYIGFFYLNKDIK